MLRVCHMAVGVEEHSGANQDKLDDEGVQNGGRCLHRGASLDVRSTNQCILR